MTATEHKHAKLGLHAKVLLQLHLEKPEDFTPTHIVDRLFVVFENLDLEKPFDEIEEEVRADEEAENR